MKAAVRGRQSFWVVSRCWPSSLEGRGGAHWRQTLGGLWLTLQYHCRLDKIGHALVKVRLNDILQDIHEIYMEQGKKGYTIMHI